MIPSVYSYNNKQQCHGLGQTPKFGKEESVHFCLRIGSTLSTRSLLFQELVWHSELCRGALLLDINNFLEPHIR